MLFQAPREGVASTDGLGFFETEPPPSIRVDQTAAILEAGNIALLLVLVVVLEAQTTEHEDEEDEDDISRSRVLPMKPSSVPEQKRVATSVTQADSVVNLSIYSVSPNSFPDHLTAEAQRRGGSPILIAPRLRVSAVVGNFFWQPL